MKKRIYIEGGGDSKELQVRCREGFRRLIKACGNDLELPRLIACGGRNSTYDSFRTAHQNAIHGDYIAMIVDSEDPVSDHEKAWDHLEKRDKWERPKGAMDEQVLLMVTCMESWIAYDRVTLRDHYGAKFQENALPPQHNMESRHRHDVQNKLEHSTRNCKNKYLKGKRSFTIFGKLNPDALSSLASFARFRRILTDKL